MFPNGTLSTITKELQGHREASTTSLREIPGPPSPLLCGYPPSLCSHNKLVGPAAGGPSPPTKCTAVQCQHSSTHRLALLTEEQRKISHIYFLKISRSPQTRSCHGDSGVNVSQQTTVQRAGGFYPRRHNGFPSPHPRDEPLPPPGVVLELLPVPSVRPAGDERLIRKYKRERHEIPLAEAPALEAP